MMYKLLLLFFLIIAIALITLIMLQQGKNTDIGSSFREGASRTLFGSSGSANFMTRTTAILAILFFSSSLLLDNLNSKKNTKKEAKWNLSASEKKEITKQVVPIDPIKNIPK